MDRSAYRSTRGLDRALFGEFGGVESSGLWQCQFGERRRMLEAAMGPLQDLRDKGGLFGSLVEGSRVIGAVCGLGRLHGSENTGIASGLKRD